MKKIAVVGSALSGGAAQIIDAVRTGLGSEVVAIFDNDVKASGCNVFDVPVVASSDEVESYWYRNFFDEIVIGIGGDLKEREVLYERYRMLNIPFANVIDSTAQLRTNVKIGTGNVILGNVFIGPNVKIGDNCYIISGTCINHDSKVGSHSYFSTGCVIAGNVEIGDRVRFDTGSGARAKTVIQSDQTIGAGIIVIKSN